MSEQPQQSLSDEEHKNHRNKEDFVQDLLTKGISSANIARLQSEGFTSWNELRLLREKDCTKLGIVPLAQNRLLWSLVTKANSTQDTRNTSESVAHTRQEYATTMEASTEETTPDATSAINNHLSTLLGNLRGLEQMDTAANAPIPSGERIDLNPLSHLLPKQAFKYHDIPDFVSHREEFEQILSQSGEQQVLLRSGPKKQRLESVSPAQWSGANMRILIELLKEGSLKMNSILDYIAYSVKISELADRFHWQSVLLYDREYRKLQAQYQFRWGSDSPHLTTLHLRTRGTTNTNDDNRRHYRQSPNPRGPSRTDQQFCKLYNRNQDCPYGANCRYLHCCSGPNCSGDHPLALHGKESKNSKNS